MFFKNYTVSNVSPALIQVASLALIVLKPPKGKPCSSIELIILYDFLQLTYTLIEQVIAAS